jgi:hypothetical protein
MKIKVIVEVPDGEWCVGKFGSCCDYFQRIKRIAYCEFFSTFMNENFKCQQCLDAKVVE